MQDKSGRHRVRFPYFLQADFRPVWNHIRASGVGRQSGTGGHRPASCSSFCCSAASRRCQTVVWLGVPPEIEQRVAEFELGEPNLRLISTLDFQGSLQPNDCRQRRVLHTLRETIVGPPTQYSAGRLLANPAPLFEEE